MKEQRLNTAQRKILGIREDDYTAVENSFQQEQSASAKQESSWFGITREQHDRVLAWTSLWILVPFFTWCMSGLMLEPGSHVAPWYLVVWLPCSAGVSLRHWIRNIRGSKTHKADMSLAISNIVIHVYLLVHIDRTLVAAGLCSALFFFFALARLTKSNYKPKDGLSAAEDDTVSSHAHVNWGQAMTFHTIFRYCAFWLTLSGHSYSVRLLDGMTHKQWWLFVVGLTTLYVQSILSLIKGRL
jgi:hypothetical protein